MVHFGNMIPPLDQLGSPRWPDPDGQRTFISQAMRAGHEEVFRTVAMFFWVRCGTLNENKHEKHHVESWKLWLQWNFDTLQKQRKINNMTKCGVFTCFLVSGESPCGTCFDGWSTQFCIAKPGLYRRKRRQTRPQSAALQISAVFALLCLVQFLQPFLYNSQHLP